MAMSYVSLSGWNIGESLAKRLNEIDPRNAYVPTGPSTITVTGNKVGVREHAERDKSLPKPPRVEKWQRWSSGYRAHVIGNATVCGRWEAGFGAELSDGILTSPHWHFLGYAKPDAVEVGQRWRTRSPAGDVTVCAFDGRFWSVKSSFGVTHWQSSLLLEQEYLGMSDGANEAKPLLAGNESHAHAATTKKPTVKFSCVVDPPLEAAMKAWGDTVVELAKRRDELRANEPLARGVIAMLATWHKQTREPRFQNEMAAKRLLANPPAWAYPRAWTCAVLAAMEQAATSDDAMLDPIAIGVACRASHERHSPTIGCAIDPGLRAAYDAYARGREKPAGLMRRPRNVMRVR